MSPDGFGFAFRRAVDESALSHKAWCVAVVLAQRANGNAGWTCYPSIETLADDSRLSERSVMRGLRELRQDGWIDWTKGTSRRGQANTYRLRVPAAYAKHPTRRDRAEGEETLPAPQSPNPPALGDPQSALGDCQSVLGDPQSALGDPQSHQSPRGISQKNLPVEEGATASPGGMPIGNAGPQRQPSPEQSSPTGMVEARPRGSAAPPVDRLAYLVALNAAMKANGDSLRPAWLRLDAIHGSEVVAEVVAELPRARRYPEPAEDALMQRAQRLGTFTEQARYDRCLEVVRVLGWRRCRDAIGLEPAAIATREDLRAALWANRATSRALIQAAPHVEAPPFRRVLAARFIDADDFGEAEWSQVWERCSSAWAWGVAAECGAKTPDALIQHVRDRWEATRGALTDCGVEPVPKFAAAWLEALRDRGPGEVADAYRRHAFADPAGMRDALEALQGATELADADPADVEPEEAQAVGEGVAKLKALAAAMASRNAADADSERCDVDSGTREHDCPTSDVDERVPSRLEADAEATGAT